jgi:hypothetical protein
MYSQNFWISMKHLSPLVMVIFSPFLIPSALAQENPSEDDYSPLVTIMFPLDNKSDTAMGHRAIEYILYYGGTCWNKQTTFGGTEKQQGPDHFSGLSQSHKDAVLKLVAQIEASEIMPVSRTKAIVMTGPATNGETLSRDFSQNIVAIHKMLRLLGGVRGDLEDHLAGAIAAADSVDERKEGWNWSKEFGDWAWDDLERQATRQGSDVAALLGSNPKAFDSLVDDISHSDGERSERDTALLVYLDCKMGHKAFIDQLARQGIKKRELVSTQLLQILTFKRDVPSDLGDLAEYLRQISPPRSEK